MCIQIYIYYEVKIKVHDFDVANFAIKKNICGRFYIIFQQSPIFKIRETNLIGTKNQGKYSPQDINMTDLKTKTQPP